MNKLGISAAVSVCIIATAIACGSQDKTSGFDTENPDGSTGGEGGANDDGGGPISQFGEGGPAPTPDSGVTATRDPATCTEATTTKSYVGCDYWPTVTANNVWSIFDYAVVVSNVSASPATVTVTGGALAAQQQVTVAPGALSTIYLPWVPELKGPDFDECTSAQAMSASVIKTGGAYHLVSSTPVIVYQFNALEYKGAGGASPDGGAKDWSTCPGTATTCAQLGEKVGCFSFSNDASLLLPSTAMTANYRVTGHTGWSESSNGLPPPFGTIEDILGAYITVTAVQDATTVTATLSANAKVLAGGAITAQTGGTLTFTLANAGDVAEIVLDKGDKYDLSGSLVQANKPIQVMSGVPCINVPEGTPACDHIEESVIPAETLGKHYVITMPDQPAGGRGKGVVRFYGNQNTTTLTYNPSTPSGCPTALSAGQMVECALGAADFEVTGDKEFAVSIFTPGASAYSSGSASDPPGDPDQSIFPSVEQFRTKYLFLAPTDYDTSYVDIVGTSDAAPMLDAKAVSGAFSQIGAGPYGVWRVTLDHGPNGDGAHSLTTTTPVGIQVMGYGGNTSYQYPGGLNLNLIAPPPPPPGVN